MHWQHIVVGFCLIRINFAHEFVILTFKKMKRSADPSMQSFWEANRILPIEKIKVLDDLNRYLNYSTKF